MYPMVMALQSDIDRLSNIFNEQRKLITGNNDVENTTRQMIVINSTLNHSFKIIIR